jgi:N-acetylglucosamine kinase-like BadF-type ATPase
MIYLGVDGGGTKTHALIVNEDGQPLSEGFSGSSNYHDHGVEATRAAIARAVDGARHAAGLVPGPFTAAFLGLGSIVSQADRRVVREIARDLALAPPIAGGP